MTKKSFILYADSYAGIKKLSLEEKGILLDCIFTYAIDKTILPAPNIVEIVFDFIKATMDYNENKYLSICEKNKRNIQKRWAKNQNKQNYEPIQSNTDVKIGIPNDSDIDNDSDSGNDSDIEEEKKNILSDIEKEKPNSYLFEKSIYFMGEQPSELPKSFLKAILQKGLSFQEGLQEFQKFTSHCLGLTGKQALKSNRGWKMAFCITWLLNAKKFAYENQKSVQTSQNYPTDEEKNKFLGRE